MWNASSLQETSYGRLGRSEEICRGGAEMKDLENELRKILNEHCMENESNTPDFILAEEIQAI
jgi:hypothetical protein